MSNIAPALRTTKTFEIKQIVLIALRGYQIIVSPLLHQLLGTKTACRSYPTCSEYAQQAIAKHGILEGSVLAMRRIINCQPFIKI